MSLAADIRETCDQVWNEEDPQDWFVVTDSRAEFVRLTRELIEVDKEKFVRHNAKGETIASLELTPEEFWTEWWRPGDTAGIITYTDGQVSAGVILTRTSPCNLYISMRWGPHYKRTWFRKVWAKLGIKELEFITPYASAIRAADKNKGCRYEEEAHGRNAHIVMYLEG